MVILKEIFPKMNFIVSFNELLLFQCFIRDSSINENFATHLGSYLQKYKIILLFNKHMPISNETHNTVNSDAFNFGYFKSALKNDVNIFATDVTFKSIKDKFTFNDNEQHIYLEYILNLKNKTDPKPNNDNLNIIVTERYLTNYKQSEMIEINNTKNEIYNKIDTFITYINEKSNEVITGSKIKIYNATIKHTTEFVQIPNPEYEDTEVVNNYNNIENKKEDKKEDKKDDKKNDINDNNKESNVQPQELNMSKMQDIIPKMILSKKTSWKLDTNYVNEKYKGFESLYLRKNDQKKIKNALYCFKEKKEVLNRLGIPDKLCVLLWGAPGTGKTSTIWAIASYLKKDIYYVNLSTIKTNEQLNYVFEHVNKNCVGGGIIVFEDIDVMTDIVHHRHLHDNKDNKDNNKDNNENEDKLTLEYFLNILQGTITIDGSVVIVTTNRISVLDSAFVRIGRFDVKIELKLCDHYQIQTIFNNFLNKNISQETLDKIPENKYIPAEIIFRIKDYIFDEDISCEEILSPFFVN